MKLKIIKLTPSEVNHLLHLIYLNEDEGWYYGNNKHYWKRSKGIKDKLEA